MALIGILFFILDKRQISLSGRTFRRFFWLMNFGIVLSFFLSTLFANPPIGFNILGGAGALLQLLAFGILAVAFVGQRREIYTLFSGVQRRMLNTMGVLMAVKIVLQLLTSFSYFSNLATTYLDFTIGYLHLTFLGVVTMGLFLFLDYFKLLHVPRNAYFFYLTGFLLTEILIFYKGIAGWQGFGLFQGYFEALALGSLLIVFTLIGIALKNISGKNPNKD